MSHLAVDPGKKAGWAVWFEDRLGHSGTVRGDSVEEVGALVRKFKIMGTLLMEDTFIPTTRDERGRVRVRNPRGIKTLLFRRHIWEVIAQQNGMSIELAHPSTWQAYFKIKRGDKEAIRKLAKTLAGREVAPDESDAVLMAVWYAAQEKAKKVVGGAR